MITHEKTITNRTGKSKRYRITQLQTGWRSPDDDFLIFNADDRKFYRTTTSSCSCPAFTYRGACKHVAAVRLLFVDSLVKTDLGEL